MSEIAARDSVPVGGVKRLALWMILLVGMVAMGVYANSIQNGFAFDDVKIVRDSKLVTEHQWLEIWRSNYWPKDNGISPDILYRPLTIWSYAVNHYFTPTFEDNPSNAWGFHLTNVILHALISMMVAILAWRILGNRAIAVVAGILFAVHPLHTEAVANVVGRAELLGAIWSLAFLLVYLPDRVLVKETGPEQRGWWHGVVVAMCFVFGLFSKETPVALAGVIVLIDGWRWLQWSRETRLGLWRWFGNRALRYYMPMAVVFAGYMYLRVNGAGWMTDVRTIHPIVNPLSIANVPERVVTPFALLGRYLALTAYPSVLSADYSAPSIMPTSKVIEFSRHPVDLSDFPVSYPTTLQLQPVEHWYEVFSPDSWKWGISVETLSLPLVLLGIMACLLAVLLGIKMWRKHPELALVLGMFVFPYIIVGNFTRIGTIFGERLFYFPSVFVLILGAWALVAVWELLGAVRDGIWLRSFGMSVTALVIAAMCVRTFYRNEDWADNVPLALATAGNNEQSAKALFWAGTILDYVVRDKNSTPGQVHARYVQLEQQDPPPWTAEKLFLKALAIYPKDPRFPEYGLCNFELAKVYGREGDLAKSILYLCKAAHAEAGKADYRVGLHGVLNDIKAHDPKTFVPEIEQYVADHPEDAAGYLARALVHHGRGELDDAVIDAKKAVALDENKRVPFNEAAGELAAILFDRNDGKKNDRVQAAFIYKSFADVMPYSADVQLKFVEILLGLNPMSEHALHDAQEYLNRAAALDPDNGRVRDLRTQLDLKKKAAAQTGKPSSAGAFASSTRAEAQP